MQSIWQLFLLHKESFHFAHCSKKGTCFDVTFNWFTYLSHKQWRVFTRGWCSEASYDCFLQRASHCWPTISHYHMHYTCQTTNSTTPHPGLYVDCIITYLSLLEHIQWMDNFILLSCSSMHSFLDQLPSPLSWDSSAAMWCTSLLELSTFMEELTWQNLHAFAFQVRTFVCMIVCMCVRGVHMHVIFVCMWMCVWSLQVPRVWFCLILPLHTGGGHNF